MKYSAIFLSIAFLLVSCDSLLSPGTETIDKPQHHSPQMLMQSPQQSSQGSWQRQKSGTTAFLNDIHFVDKQTGWVVGSDGVILHTTNGGETWRQQESGTGNTLVSVHFLKTSGGFRGWTVGTGGAPDRKNIILHTNDGGQTWQRQKSGIDIPLTSVYFVDAQNGWATGGRGLILRTSDEGETWQRQESGTDNSLSEIHFVDTQTGWTVGLNNILHTSDGGETWRQQKSETNFRSIHFVDAQTGWVVGDPGFAGEPAPILHTTDGGQTWWQQESRTENSLRSVYAVNEQTAWVLERKLGVSTDGIILHTTNGGQTWRRQVIETEGYLTTVHFVDTPKDFQGWTVGQDGIILHHQVGKTPEPRVRYIYEDGLGAPWINASWNATIAFNSTEQVRSGSQAIRVDQNGWGALSLHSGSWDAPEDIRPGEHEWVEFAVYAEADPVVFELQLENSEGASFPRVRHGMLRIEPGEWTLVSVPFSELNPEHRVFHRLNIAESSGSARTYHIDDLRLMGGKAKDTPRDDPAPENPAMLMVYQDELSTPWIDASWSAAVDYANSEHTHSGSQSIRVDQRAWGALSVRSGRWGDPQNIEPGTYDRVEFAVYAPDQPITVDLLLENEEAAKFPRIRYGTIEAGTWTTVSMPLSKLNPNGQPFNRIDIAESSGQARIYFVDELKLAGGSGSGPMVANTN